MLVGVVGPARHRAPDRALTGEREVVPRQEIRTILDLWSFNAARNGQQIIYAVGTGIQLMAFTPGRDPARRRGLQRLTSGGLPDLADEDVMRAAWQR